MAVHLILHISLIAACMGIHHPVGPKAFLLVQCVSFPPFSHGSFTVMSIVPNNVLIAIFFWLMTMVPAMHLSYNMSCKQEHIQQMNCCENRKGPPPFTHFIPLYTQYNTITKMPDIPSVWHFCVIIPLHGPSPRRHSLPSYDTPPDVLAVSYP